MFHYMTVDDAELSVGYGKEIQLGLDPDARLGRDSIPVRRPVSQSRESGFKSHCGRFEPLFDHPTLPQFTQLYK